MITESTARMASVAIAAHKPELAALMTDGVYRRLGIDPAACGVEDRDKSERDIGFHLNYLADALWAEDPALFTNYITWANVLFANLNFSPAVLPTTLEVMRTVLSEVLTIELSGVSNDYVMLGLLEASEKDAVVPSFLTAESPLTGLAAQYLALLLQGQRHTAVQLILDAVRQGVSVSDIYLDVFQQTQKEIGRLWQMNEISVAQEHYCTAVTQFTMSQLYPYIFTAVRKDRRMVATSVGGELHEIGIRMVADFFELNGWDTYYLGANTPTESVVQAVAENGADLVAISATLTPHVQKVANLVEAIRTMKHPPRVMVGGYPFNLSKNLWRIVGADGTAGDARQAVQTGERLIA
jgi:methanogenic corrinoid protein MtbC1